MTSLVPNVYAAIFIPVPASTLALVLRLKARRMTRMGMGRDDVFAIAAWVLAVGYTVDLIVWATCFKLGRQIASYGEKKVEYYMEKSSLILWTSEYLYAWSIFCAKIAVLCFYRRLFRFSSIRVPIILLIAACTIWIIIRTFFTTFHCIPIQAFWVRNIPNAKCITNVAAFYMGTDVTHCLMDFIILALPIWEVVRMKLPFGQKIAVVCLFATGAFVGVASIFQIIHSQQFKADSNELPYDLALSMVWGNVELHLAVFIGKSSPSPPPESGKPSPQANWLLTRPFKGCLVLLRPIFSKYVPGLATGASHAASRLARSRNIFRSGGSRQLSSPGGDSRAGPVVLITTTTTQNSSLAPKVTGSSLVQTSFHHDEYHVDSLVPSQDDVSTCPQSTVMKRSGP
ncbi:integral membrane protein [Metarhizium rileyi]|uniref:Integral membrane protein n=1 Tax=Metarhizium rileyi (strain RCEF 4871) TaxID=1649241 RepID=A0A166ZE25_METRR|nr:integral membrane protein [Metarhizium rileyi RCEF 4871]